MATIERPRSKRSAAKALREFAESIGSWVHTVRTDDGFYAYIMGVRVILPDGSRRCEYATGATRDGAMAAYACAISGERLEFGPLTDRRQCEAPDFYPMPVYAR